VTGRLTARDRHRAREAALQMLYQWEVGHGEPAEVATSYWMLDGAGMPVSDAARRMATELALGTIAGVPAIDPLLADSADNWRLARMAVVDRLILRLAVHELQSGDAPPSVVINEALELARTFSTEDAVKFVNGVLDAIRRRLEAAAPPAPTG
jgi:transcription antitermination protein NusB